MLDAIADHSKGRDAGRMYGRLSDPGAPGVTFSLFLLDAHELDEDVYVKLNARGLALTAFDSFKVGFELLLSRQQGPGPGGRPWNDWKVLVADRLDTKWSETVWRLGRAASAKNPGQAHSDNMLTFVRALAYLAALAVPLEDDLPLEEPSAIQRLRDDLRMLDPAKPVAAAALDARVLEPLLAALLPLLESVLDALSQALTDGHSPWFPADSLCHMLQGEGLATPGGAERATFTDHAQVLGWFLFLRHHPGRVADPDVAPELREWTRLVHHYTTHIGIRATDLDFVALALGRMAEGVAEAGEGVLAFAASQSFLDTFRPPRAAAVDAEWRKARVLVADAAWRDLLDPIEQHVLHRGDIDFLLRFAGIEVEDAADWTATEHASHRAELARWADASLLVFPAQEANDGSFRLERALLALGADLRRQGGVSHRVPDWGTRGYQWRDAVAVGAKGLAASRTAVEALVRGWLDADGRPKPNAYLEAVVREQRRVMNAADKGDRWEPWLEILVQSPLAIRYCCGEEPRGRRGKRNIAFFRREGMHCVALQKTTNANGEKFDLYLYAVLGDLRGVAAPTVVDGNPSEGRPWATFEPLGVRAEVHDGTLALLPLDPAEPDGFKPRSGLSARQAARWLRARARQVSLDAGRE